MFTNKTWSLGGLKALIKKMTTQVLLFDLVGSGRPRVVRTYVVNFLISAFSLEHFSFVKGISYFLIKILSSTYLQC